MSEVQVYEGVCVSVRVKCAVLFCVGSDVVDDLYALHFELFCHFLSIQHPVDVGDDRLVGANWPGHCQTARYGWSAILVVLTTHSTQTGSETHKQSARQLLLTVVLLLLLLVAVCAALSVSVLFC